LKLLPKVTAPIRQTSAWERNVLLVLHNFKLKTQPNLLNIRILFGLSWWHQLPCLETWTLV